jgi:hypothetical protein
VTSYPSNDTKTAEATVGEWAANTGAAITRDTTAGVFRTGVAALKIVNTTAYASCFARPAATYPGYVLNVNSPKRYTFWAKRSTTAVNILMSVHWYGDVDTVDYGETFYGGNSVNETVLTTTYAFIDSGIIVPPPLATKATITLSISAAATAWVDDLDFFDAAATTFVRGRRPNMRRPFPRRRTL